MTISNLLTRDMLTRLLLPKCYWLEYFSIHLDNKPPATSIISSCKIPPVNSQDHNRDQASLQIQPGIFRSSPLPISLWKNRPLAPQEARNMVAKSSSWLHLLVPMAQIWLIRNAFAGDFSPILRTCWLTWLINHLKHSRELPVCGFLGEAFSEL